MLENGSISMKLSEDYLDGYLCGKLLLLKFVDWHHSGQTPLSSKFFLGDNLSVGLTEAKLLTRDIM